MKIEVENKGTKFPIVIAIPNFLINNKTAIKMILDKGNVKLPQEVVEKLIRVINDYVKSHGHFTLVEVESSDTKISVTL